MVGDESAKAFVGVVGCMAVKIVMVGCHGKEGGFHAMCRRTRTTTTAEMHVGGEGHEPGQLPGVGFGVGEAFGTALGPRACNQARDGVVVAGGEAKCGEFGKDVTCFLGGYIEQHDALPGCQA